MTALWREVSNYVRHRWLTASMGGASDCANSQREWHDRTGKQHKTGLPSLWTARTLFRGQPNTMGAWRAIVLQDFSQKANRGSNSGRKLQTRNSMPGSQSATVFCVSGCSGMEQCPNHFRDPPFVESGRNLPTSMADVPNLPPESRGQRSGATKAPGSCPSDLSAYISTHKSFCQCIPNSLTKQIQCTPTPKYSVQKKAQQSMQL